MLSQQENQNDVMNLCLFARCPSTYIKTFRKVFACTNFMPTRQSRSCPWSVFSHNIERRATEILSLLSPEPSCLLRSSSKCSKQTARTVSHCAFPQALLVVSRMSSGLFMPSCLNLPFCSENPASHGPKYRIHPFGCSLLLLHAFAPCLTMTLGSYRRTG